MLYRPCSRPGLLAQLAHLGAVAICCTALLCAAGGARAASTTNGLRRVLVMDVQHAGGVDADTAQAITDLVTGQLSKLQAFYVVSGSELSQLAVLEEAKQRGDCTDNVCLAELADALGARYVVFGRASTLGEIIVLQLRLFDAKEARFLSRANVETRTVEELSQEIEATVDRLMHPILDPSERRAIGGMRAQDDIPGEAENDEEGDGPSPLLWAGVGTMGLGALVGVGAMIGGIYFDGAVRDPASTPAQRAEARELGQPLVIGALATSGLLLVGGVVMTVLGLGD
jgi:TolB-like protein